MLHFFVRDIRQLQTRVAVADTGSFSAAAAIVDLTPSAVGQQIQSLAGELGVELFDRKRRPRQLNTKGQDLVRAAVVQTMTEARMATSGGSTAGVLEFGAIRTVSMHLVPQACAEMQAAFAELSCDLSVGMSERLMTDVAAGRLDAALVAEHVGVPASLCWSPVLSEPLVLIAPPAEAWRFDRSLLKDMPFIRDAMDVPLARQIETELPPLRVSGGYRRHRDDALRGRLRAGRTGRGGGPHDGAADGGPGRRARRCRGFRWSSDRGQGPGHPGDPRRWPNACRSSGR